MRQFVKFAKTPLYRGYFQNHHQLSPSFLTFFKKFYLSTNAIAKTPRKGHTISKLFSKKSVTLYRGYFHNLSRLHCCFPKKSEKNITSTPLTIKIAPLFCHTPFQLFQKNFSSPIGVISQTSYCCVATFGKNSEKHHLPPLTIAITPLFCNTLFQLFSKIFVSPLLTITFFLRFVSAFLKKVEKSYRSGIKS